MSALSFSSLTATAVRSPLELSRDQLVAAADRVPGSVDAGVLTPTVTSIVARMLEEVGLVAATVDHLSAQVQVTAADFAATDTSQAQCYADGAVR
ncbi:hypothetical protein [Nocardioides solisilvae]|uniref:hypothetical protein n=1 Tax=Nocardioides solisilvae TaxID=1542435 RepID=UPI000D74D28A|nr:hypothetical protein [Nocardioides solisilvae]